VALARALAVQPQVLLLDEPFGALDAKVRKELRTWLRKLHDEVHLTSVFVTHDQEEAMEVADEIVVMNHGKIEQVGTAAEIYDHPATPFVMSFIGEVNALPHPVFRQDGAAIAHGSGHVFVRPHDFDLQLTVDDDTIPAVVKRITHLGWEVQMELSIANHDSVYIQLSREKYEEFKPEVGQTFFIKPRRTKVFAEVNGGLVSRFINGAGI
jgi:sulfate transport system ATP-binding protein